MIWNMSKIPIKKKMSKMLLEIFDDIINEGRVPSESSFHVLITACLSSQGHGCLDEECNIYKHATP